jgi:hypothetical protein
LPCASSFGFELRLSGLPRYGEFEIGAVIAAFRKKAAASNAKFNFVGRTFFRREVLRSKRSIMPGREKKRQYQMQFVRSNEPLSIEQYAFGEQRLRNIVGERSS